MDIPANDDGLKWFGEGFDGFPKKLPDDCVEYIIHVIDSKLQTAAATRSRLNEILKFASAQKKKWLKDYIWQRGSFELKIHPQPVNDDVKVSRLNDSPLHLRGRTNFGDSVADEWLIVFLLLDLSKQHPDAWIRVYDTDGEFLLIEAANALPKWLNPDIAENRVWINNGHLRVIPLDNEISTSKNLSLPDSLSFISQQPEKLIISPFIEDEAFYRIREYPSAISSSLHHALMSMPRKLAYILHHDPAYISPATEAFYLRDPVSLRPLTTKDTSTLTFPPEDFVTVSTSFTKVGYAQLRSQIFDPPPAWTAVVPRMQDPKAQMGLKITCGFEMLLADRQHQNDKAVREIKFLTEDVDSGADHLPSDSDIAAWPQTQDGEKWLDIEYEDFENELSGKAKRGDQSSGRNGFGDASAQDNLRKMVSRFEDFLNDDTTGTEGIDDDDLDEDESDSGDEPDSDSGEDKDARNFDEAEFEKAIKEMMGMPADYIEKSGLLDEARKLAVEDAAGSEGEVDEDEEMKKVMALMEQELKGHGALNLNQGKAKAKAESGTKTNGAPKPVYGPERPPGMEKRAMTKRGDDDESADEEIGPGDGELSSDDEEFNDVDLGLAKNMLEAFKGQAGLAGPAGNMMRAMGINMPRDEGEECSNEDLAIRRQQNEFEMSKYLQSKLAIFEHCTIDRPFALHTAFKLLLITLAGDQPFQCLSKRLSPS